MHKGTNVKKKTFWSKVHKMSCVQQELRTLWLRRQTEDIKILKHTSGSLDITPTGKIVTNQGSTGLIIFASCKDHWRARKGWSQEGRREESRPNCRGMILVTRASQKIVISSHFPRKSHPGSTELQSHTHKNQCSQYPRGKHLSSLVWLYSKIIPQNPLLWTSASSSDFTFYQQILSAIWLLGSHSIIAS